MNTTNKLPMAVNMHKADRELLPTVENISGAFQTNKGTPCFVGTVTFTDGQTAESEIHYKEDYNWGENWPETI